jgi:hypothetical protein
MTCLTAGCSLLSVYTAWELLLYCSREVASVRCVTRGRLVQTLIEAMQEVVVDCGLPCPMHHEIYALEFDDAIVARLRFAWCGGSLRARSVGSSAIFVEGRLRR